MKERPWVCCVCLGSREPTLRPNDWRTMDARARVFMCPVCLQHGTAARDLGPWDEWTAYVRADVRRPPGAEVVDHDKLIVLFRGAVVVATQYRRHPHAPGAPNDCQDLRFRWEWGVPGENRRRDYAARERADAGPIGVGRWSSPSTWGEMQCNAGAPEDACDFACGVLESGDVPDRWDGGFDGDNRPVCSEPCLCVPGKRTALGETPDPDARCPKHGCSRWRCDVDHDAESL